MVSQVEELLTLNNKLLKVKEENEVEALGKELEQVKEKLEQA